MADRILDHLMTAFGTRSPSQEMSQATTERRAAMPQLEDNPRDFTTTLVDMLQQIKAACQRRPQVTACGHCPASDVCMLITIRRVGGPLVPSEWVLPTPEIRKGD